MGKEAHNARTSAYGSEQQQIRSPDPYRRHLPIFIRSHSPVTSLAGAATRRATRSAGTSRSMATAAARGVTGGDRPAAV